MVKLASRPLFEIGQGIQEWTKLDKLDLWLTAFKFAVIWSAQAEKDSESLR